MPNPPDHDPDPWDERFQGAGDPRDDPDYAEYPQIIGPRDPRDRSDRDGPTLPASRQTGAAGRVWRPEPLRPPSVQRELPRLTWPERCAESIRYAVLAAEHWLSSGGVLREWIRLNLRVAVCLLAGAVLVVPPATFILESTAEWAALLASTARNISGTILGLPPVVVALTSIYLLARLVHRRLLLRRHYQRDHHDPYR